MSPVAMAVQRFVIALLCLLHVSSSSCIHDKLSRRLVSGTQVYSNDPRRPADATYGESTEQQLQWPPYANVKHQY